MAKSAAAADNKKQPSRKQCRKGRSLQEEYRRRQRDHVWLETHIWHAKRFKVANRYGYQLAESACDKGLRAAYRSLKHGCLLSVSGDGCMCVGLYVPYVAYYQSVRLLERYTQLV